MPQKTAYLPVGAPNTWRRHLQPHGANRSRGNAASVAVSIQRGARSTG
jgi:hypothetical protein